MKYAGACKFFRDVHDLGLLFTPKVSLSLEDLSQVVTELRGPVFNLHCRFGALITFKSHQTQISKNGAENLKNHNKLS